MFSVNRRGSFEGLNGGNEDLRKETFINDRMTGVISMLERGKRFWLLRGRHGAAEKVAKCIAEAQVVRSAARRRDWTTVHTRSTRLVTALEALPESGIKPTPYELKLLGY
jgi:hypothetical protein